MKHLIYILIFITSLGFSQEKDSLQDIKHIYKGNQELKQDDFINAEAEYRKAIAANPSNNTAKYNLGNAYYRNKKSTEALMRYNQAAKIASKKEDKHQSFHNIGNSFMQEKKYQEAVDAYKQALRNNPKDDETRYNLALAKKMLEDQQKDQDQNKDQQDNKDQNKDQKDDKGEQDKNKEGDQKDEGDEGENEDNKDPKDDEGDQKDEKEGNGDQKEQPKPQQGQLSPEQVQSILNAMNNEEKKVQNKMNEKKGVPVQTEKDW